MTSYKYPLSKLILKSALAGEIKPVLLKDPVDPKGKPIFFPSQIPAIVMGGNVGFVNISPKASYVRNKLNNIEALNVKEINLYAFLQMAYLELNFRKHSEKINKSNPVTKNTAIAYSRMFSRCIDRTYSINANLEAQSLSLFMGQVFALVTFFDYSIEEAINFTFSSKMSERDVIEHDSRLLREGKFSFNNIEEFISLYNYELDAYIKSGTLNLRSVVNLWQKMYGANSWFGIEHAGTFLTTILSPHIDYYNDKFISTITKTQADNISSALATIFSS